MENAIEIKDEFGDKILVMGDSEGKFISTLECGYVIDLEGNFIIVGNNHGETLSYFYRNYTKERIQEEDTITMIKKLTELGLIVYLGTWRDKQNQKLLLDNGCYGIGVLYFSILENITNEQKCACKKLLDSNKCIINKNVQKIEIYFGSGLDSSVEYMEDEIVDFLNTNNLQSKIS